MRTRRIAGLAIVAVLAAAACTTDRELTRPAAAEITTDRLGDATIAIEELPAALEPSPRAGRLNDRVTYGHTCDEPLDELVPDAEATRSYRAGEQRLTSSVAWFPGRGAQAEQTFRRVRDGCESVASRAQGVSIRSGPLDLGALGDRTLAIHVETERLGEPIVETGIVVLRQGDLVSVVRLTGPRPIDRALLDAAARDAIGRLAALAGNVEA